jgi:hypothetical protein
MNYKEKINSVFNVPLFEALAHRRVRRFGLGYEFAKDDTFRYKSTKAPVALDETETALLSWAGNGISGISLGVGQVGTGVHSTWNGRTHPCACNNQHALLIIVNDDGVFSYEPPNATKIVEIASEGDRDKIVDIYRKGLRQLSNKRPDFTDAAWISANTWMANQPGSTTFFPVVDLSAEHINHALAISQRERLKPYDEFHKCWAGVDKWIDNGYLDGSEVTMQFLDQATLIVQAAFGFLVAQNISLASEAIGLGCAVTSPMAPVVLGGTPFSEGLGFRFTTDVAGELNPVGLDGILQGLIPPYKKDMSEAVDEFLDTRYGGNGILTPEYEGATPFKDWKDVASKAGRLNPSAIQSAKDFCNYVYDTFGRFPATADTIQLPMMITVHHLDTDFYDQYFPKEAVTDKIRNHMADWHGK